VNGLTTDFLAPTISASSVAPSLARVGTTVTASFTASEALASTPSVTLGGQTMSLQTKSGNTYSFSRTIVGNETSGLQSVTANVTDTVGNTAALSVGSTTLDFTAPSFSALTASPSLAKSGTLVTFSFVASEPLQANPTVTVAVCPRRFPPWRA